MRVPNRSCARVALVLLASLAADRAFAQDRVDATITSDEWDVWVDGAPCTSPCTTSAVDGALDYQLSERNAEQPSGSVHLDIAAPARSSLAVHHGRWSHAGERTAGVATIVGGWLGGLALAIGLSAWVTDAFDHPCTVLCFGPGIYALVYALPPGLFLGILGSIIGGALMDLDDYSTTTTSHGVLSDDPGGRALGYVTATVVGLGIVVPLVALGVGFGADSFDAAVFSGLSLGIVAAPFLVTLAGHIGGARGDLGAASLGAAIPVLGVASAYAIAATALAAYGYEATLTQVSIGALSCALVLGLAGSIVGYEIAHARARARDAASLAIRVEPTFAASNTGASIGLAGLF